MSNVIGGGILFTPPQVAAAVPNPYMFLGTWVAGGLLAFAGAMAYAELAALRPRAGVPTLEAELYDGTGSVLLVWLGRRRIGGIECGRSLTARGRLTVHDGRPTLYNAEYELRPTVV